MNGALHQGALGQERLCNDAWFQFSYCEIFYYQSLSKQVLVNEGHN